MYFRQILHTEKACASYLVGCPTRGVCAVVDPQGDPQVYARQAAENGMTLAAVIDTHVHADHISGARALAAASGASLYLGTGAGVGFAHLSLADGQVLDVGNRRMRVLRTPGHTSEHVSLVVDDWFVLTGDTMFVGDVGRVDLALDGLTADAIHARAAELYRSLRRLLELPDWTEVYPGHFAGSVCGRGMDGKPITTIGRERRHNPALQLSEEAFIAYQTRTVPPLPPDFRAIKQRNLGA
jgi:hydroxyacylglutathione hydrolase